MTSIEYMKAKNKIVKRTIDKKLLYRSKPARISYYNLMTEEDKEELYQLNLEYKTVWIYLNQLLLLLLIIL